MKPFIKVIRKYIILEILFDILCTIMLAFTPILQKWLFDEGLNGGIYVIIKMVAIYGIIQLLYAISVYLCMLMTWKGAIKFELILKRSYLKSIFYMKNQEFYEKPIGEYISMQGNNITALEQDYLQPLVDVIRSLNMLLIYGVITFVLVDWRISLTIIFCSLITVIGPKLTGKAVSGSMNKYLTQMAHYVSKITDLLEGFKLVDNYTREHINKVHEDVLAETAEKRYVFGRSKTMSLSVNELAIKIIQTVSFAVTGILLVNGEITIGTGVATFGYVSSFLQPINSILYDVSALQSVKEVKEKFLRDISRISNISLIKPKGLQNDISINKVNYKYDNFSLENITFHFEVGKKYAIIGHSGSGKSTLLKLIMGFFEPNNGSICIDGIPLSDTDTSELISYTDQSEHIYQDGYIENATVYGSYSTEKLRHVMNEISIKIINIIKTKKSNENCQELSGGEKQTLSFLRMLTKDASIILMDEPFAAVDKKSKEYFENYLFSKKEMNHKLLIFVTHDLGETLYQYDEVLLMREGKIIAHDKYERLREMSEYKSFHEQKI